MAYLMIHHPMVISQWLHLREADAGQAEVTNLQVTSARMNAGFNEWEKLEFNFKKVHILQRNCFI